MTLTLRSAASLLSFFIVVSLFNSCTEQKPSKAKEAFSNVIPKPSSATSGGSSFFIKDSTTVFADTTAEGVKPLGRYLAGQFGIKVSKQLTGKDQITLALSSDTELGDEGYQLDINSGAIAITANKPAGLFYGIQTLRQIGVEAAAGYEFAGGKVRDWPTFGWRGSMLDVARHFFTVNDVKRYIDLLATYKMNVLHLSLTNDQGWRIEIKSWPNLTAIGGKTQVGGNGGGFYTQEEYKELVRYAQQRFITIIPEVDMPGHTNAALASYPELNCNGKATQLYEGTEVGFSSLCRSTPKNEEITLKFVNDVIRELSQITPGPYIHVGGDESHATSKEDYIAFVKAFKKIVQANNKYMVGWEEVSQSDIGPGDVAQYWSSKEHSAVAVQKGAKLIMSPASKVYLDMKYYGMTKLGLRWAGLIEVDDAYNWKIEDMIAGVSLDNVVGVETPIWTETLATMNDLEYMMFPRLPGIAELAWHYEGRDWEEYKVRLAKHGRKMAEWDINYYRSPKIDWNIEY